jgi:pimeloyl-ACP methyl ester carboxylesterase
MPELCLRGGELDGIVLRFVTEGSGAPVLLLHGLGGFAAVWRHNIPVLGRHATAIALDLPGFGRSSKPPGPYPLAFFARAIEAFRRALGLDRLTLVGHSMGGAVALAYALEYPSRVGRLALVGAAVPGFGYRVSWGYRLLAARGLGEIAVGDFQRAVVAGRGEDAHDLHVEVQSVSHESRVHLDIESDDIEAEVERLERLGATRVAAVKTWVVMQAPTGQRFCVVQRKDFTGARGVSTWP